MSYLEKSRRRDAGATNSAFYGSMLLAGMAADIVVFDHNTVGSARRGEMRNDLPGGGRRIVMTAQGIEHVVVNGQTLYDDGKLGNTLPGQVLRSGNC